jgi:hypothetical protein
MDKQKLERAKDIESLLSKLNSVGKGIRTPCPAA